MMNALGLGLLVTSAWAGEPPGMVVVPSAASMEQTTAAVKAGIASRGLNLFATVDHEANAKGVDLALQPTTLFIFGNPKVGTQLMAVHQTMGLDLPMKMLVWQDADGKVFLGYNAPTYLVERHAIEGTEALVTKIDGVLSGLAAEAAKAGE